MATTSPDGTSKTAMVSSDVTSTTVIEPSSPPKATRLPCGRPGHVTHRVAVRRPQGPEQFDAALIVHDRRLINGNHHVEGHTFGHILAVLVENSPLAALVEVAHPHGGIYREGAGPSARVPVLGDLEHMASGLLFARG